MIEALHFEFIQNALAAGREDLDFFRLDRDAFAACPADSIDYAVMEKTALGAMLPLDAGWNDVGSWDALDTLLSADAAGNFIVGNDVVSVASQGNIAYGSGRLIALVGVQDLVIVDTGDALLIGHRDQMQKVKDVVTTLKDHARDDLL